MIARSFNYSTLFTVVLTLSFALTHSANATVGFDWVTVGNAGNVADTTGFGAVSYEYRIATTEVTNAQYAEFLNAKAATDSLNLYETAMGFNFGGISRSGTSGSYSYNAKAGRENNPAGHTSWYRSIRFINWMHNGQGSGDTETGAYTLLGGTEFPSNGLSITRNAGANYFMPSENEWYKAAYHDASAGTAGVYFLYATGSNTVPISDQPGDNPAAVNYFNDDDVANGFNDGYAVSGSSSFPGSTNPFTDVGAYADAKSSYGTLDQNGSVWEWNEAPFESGFSSRTLRGGSWFNLASLDSSVRTVGNPFVGDGTRGFRVAASEPSIPDIFQVIVISRNASGHISLTWESQTGSSYQVERSPSMRAGTWTPVSALLPGLANSMNFTHTGATGEEKGFYRVVRTAP